MKFYGIKKLSLIDYPNKFSCVLFTYGCTLRCPFCHNRELVTGSKEKLGSVSEEEVLQFLQSRKGKLDAVTITGGEPLMYGDSLLSFVSKVKNKGFLVKLDTNGTFPDLLRNFLELDLLDYVAIDYKLPFKLYTKLGATQDQIVNVKESVNILLGSKVEHEFRTTLVPKLHSIKVIDLMIKEFGDVVGDKWKFNNFRSQNTLNEEYKGSKEFSDREFRELCRYILSQSLISASQRGKKWKKPMI